MDWSSFIFKPFVMDKESLQKVVLEQGLGDQGERIAKMEGIQFSDVHELSLGYKDILKIDHLWEFTSLTKLELNSNLIKKIEGLDRLTNLTWLDLSFNKIEKIVGLETLKNLELLNLSNNKISVIENMDTLEKLTIFSIADNLLENSNLMHLKVLSLRRFKNLFSLNISGNPLSKDEDCKYLIAANFPKLKYLNCRYLDEKTVSINCDELSDPEPLTDKINVCIDEIQQLRESLLMLEFELISQMEVSIYDCLFCRDLENEYNEKVRNVAVATLEKVAKGNVEEDMPEDVRMLFMDKDNVMDVLATCHNNHVLAISDRETHLITRLNDWKDGLIKARNRMGISDINSYVDYLMEQLNELQ
uniref:Dynein regulatory complex subunit 3 n=1 Tax=Sphaeramia orbicularis TaxID=375764 RepID=A0A672Z440_9TELE